MKYKIINSDVYAGLKSLDNNIVDFAVTSPPYWGQRDYGFEGQIGNEPTYLEYISKLTKIFSILRNKLTDKGVFFLNIGDKYLSSYGKSALGFIPYLLAYGMKNGGWFLNEIFIWYKPNHMPSSIKNRFTNSYEPIFVFSKSSNNYFSDKRNLNSDYSNILKVNLQPTPYRHVAVYPEKLIYNLFQLVLLPPEATVLDPFAGSGTTLKVVKDNFPLFKAIMIENQTDYLDIIKKRCGMNGNVDILKYNYIPYNFQKDKTKNSQLSPLEDTEIYPKLSISNRNGFIKICDNKEHYYLLLKKFFTKSIMKYIDNKATCFIGCKNFDIDLIYQTSLLNKKGWIIRNLIIIEENNKWYPLFMIVDDNKKTDYIFNYKNLNLKSKTAYSRDWIKTNFTGYKVIDSVNKTKREGIVVEIVETYSNKFPKFAIVRWDDGKFTKEFIVYSNEEINKNVQIYVLKNKFIIQEKENITLLNKEFKTRKKYEHLNNYQNTNQVQYNGKFKDEKRINWGASPGARSSVEKEYFSLQRLYEVDQNFVADYINSKRIEKGLSKSELTNLFPKLYKHTIGHWLRKDFGGSVPSPLDWMKLSDILNFEEGFTNYVCKTALKLQTVKNGEYKLPEDFMDSSSIKLIEKLISV